MNPRTTAFLLLGISLLARGATADIYSWRDARGVRHFTNVTDEIPLAYRDTARVVARERGDHHPPAAPEDLVRPSNDAEPRPMAQVVYDPRHLARVYEEGIAAGLRHAARSTAETPPSPVIAPVTLTQIPIVAPYGPILTPGCALPGWGGGFDRGLTRHRTWRLAQQRCLGRLDPRFPRLDLTGPGFPPRQPAPFVWR